VRPAFGTAAVLTLLSLGLWMAGPERWGLVGMGGGDTAPRPDSAAMTPGDTATAGRAPNVPLDADSAALGADSTRDSARGAPLSGKDNAPRDAAASPRSARMVQFQLSSNDSAQLFIDNRAVGVGTWSGERAPAARMVVRAVLPSAPATCDWAARDTVLTGLRAGQTVTLALPVRHCVPVHFDVEPRDARVLILPLDGGLRIETRADSAETLELPAGRYEVRTSARRCFTITDTIAAVLQADGSPVSRRLRLLCN